LPVRWPVSREQYRQCNSAPLNRGRLAVGAASVSCSAPIPKPDAAVPLFFFHMNIDGHRVADEEGSQYADLEAAKVEGLASAEDLFKDKLRRMRPVRNAHIEIVDEAGEILATVPLDIFLN
jgi:hypothetical protein